MGNQAAAAEHTYKKKKFLKQIAHIIYNNNKRIKLKKIRIKYKINLKKNFSKRTQYAVLFLTFNSYL